MEIKERLIVGVDDSNHAGDDRVKGEIDFATFSFCEKDAQVREFTFRRNYNAFNDWISCEERDYRFMILKSPKYRHKDNNLIITTPLLVMAFLEQNCVDIGSLEVYLEGVLRTHERASLIHTLRKRTGIENITARAFIKKRKTKGKIIKGYYCPEVVYRADTGANMFFSKSFEELVSDPRLVNTL